VPDPLAWVAGRRASRLRRLAIQYVEHGWPIARLATQQYGRCACGLLACVEPHLVLGPSPVITTATVADDAFASGRWAIGLLTQHFDVLELPASFGAHLHHQLRMQCPTSLAPATRQWQFVVTPRSVPHGLVEAAGGHVYGGSSDWIVAPGTYTETTGRIRWLTPPYMTGWRPYQRRDPIDVVFSTVDWSDVDAPSVRLPGLIDEALT
jgi:hypothetical protein